MVVFGEVFEVVTVLDGVVVVVCVVNVDVDVVVSFVVHAGTDIEKIIKTNNKPTVLPTAIPSS